MKFEELLKKKWQTIIVNGAIGLHETYYKDKKQYCNYLYNALPQNVLKKEIETTYFAIHPKLLEFYNKYNGVNLLSEHISIYGYYADYTDVPLPYNIVLTTTNTRADLYNAGLPYEDIVFCGDYARKYYLYYNQKEMGKFYLLDISTMKPIQVFDSIEEFLELYTRHELSLLDEFDRRNRKTPYDPVLRPKDIEFQKSLPSVHWVQNSGHTKTRKGIVIVTWWNLKNF